MAAMAGVLHTLLGWFPVTVQMAAVMLLAVPSIACATGLEGSFNWAAIWCPRQALQHLGRVAGAGDHVLVADVEEGDAPCRVVRWLSSELSAAVGVWRVW